jgi:DNA primase large subunit
LINLLSRSATQEAAKQALIAYGDTIVGTLRDSLADPSENLRTRRAIPDVLARTQSQRAADMLILELKKEDPEIEAELIEASHRMRSNSPELVFQEKVVLARVVSLIRKCYLLLLQIHDLRADKKKEILAKDLENNLSRAMKHIFELLGLILPQEDVIRAYQNILAGTRKSLDYSVELLDNILRKDVKELLLPLIEDTPFEEKVGHSRKMLKAAEKIDFT